MERLRRAVDRAYAGWAGSGQAPGRARSTQDSAADQHQKPPLALFGPSRGALARRSGMRAAAIDLGSVRVGLAVADDLGMLAHPRDALDGRDRPRLIALLRRLADDEGIEVFLVGLPRSMDGSEGKAARRARDFAEALGQKSGRAVELVDERLSTVEAAARLREGGHDSRRARHRVDSAAAAVLLQAWLDARSRPST